MRGAVGSGKTSLLRAILGLLEVDSGEVRWNGTVVADRAAFFVPPQSAYVAQVPRLFAESLASNLRLGHEVTDDELLDALALAALDTDVAALPDGLRGRVDLLLANAPYVPTGSLPLLPPEARDHEPRAALDGGTDGLDVQRRAIAGAPHWLAPGGRLLVETSTRQAARTVEAVEGRGLSARVAECEELDATVVIGAL